MYRAVMADDENKVRLVIKMLADWTRIGIELVGEYEDGDELCSHLKEDQPDIVITDMKMPGIHGSELIAKLEEINPNMKIIVISGFDDFEYMRQALRSRAVDYLLKPVMEENLNQALEKAVDELNQRQEHLKREQLSESRAYQINDFIYDGKNAEDFLPYLEWSYSQAWMYRVVYVILYNQKQGDTGAEQERMDRLGNLIQDRFLGHGTWFPDLRAQASFFLICQSLSDALIEDVLETAVKEAGDCQTGFLAGIGEEYSEYQGLQNSFIEAKIAAWDVDLKGESKVCHYRDINYTVGDEIDFVKAEFLLDAAVKSKNHIQIRKSIERLYEKVNDSIMFRVKSLNGINQLILKKLEELLVELDVSRMYYEELRKLGKSLSENLDVDLILMKISAFLDKLPVSALKGRAKTGKAEQIKSYLDAHFQEKISLDMLSREFYLNKEYLSKIFKQEYATGIFEYVDFLKMEKAKELFGAGKSIKEITEELGFYDESHFTKKFKKMIGISPKEYKR